VAPVVALLALLDGLALYQVAVRADRAPSFRRGGQFLSAAKLPADRAVPYGALDAGTTTTVAGLPSSSTSGATVTSGTATPRVSSTKPAATPTTPIPTSSPTSPLPAAGVYTYAVTGTESATGFGSRTFPATMTTTVHTAEGLAADELVLDLVFSNQHEEREIVAWRPDGVAFTFEGGSITFGSTTQTSEADYEPAMTQVPLPLGAGVARAGTSRAKDSSGNVTRTEDWKVKVEGQDTVVIAGVPTPTWVVTIDRQTKPGSADQVSRKRRYWYDPARKLWVRWAEDFVGARNMFGLTFSYEAHYTATLQSFRA
jgi:hypothetical protein